MASIPLMIPSPASSEAPAVPIAPAAPRRRRQWTYAGPRCPQCAGPLVFGEGCSLCPVCGHSSCAV